MEIQEIDINEIKPYKNNPREIPMESVQKVMNSIKEFGNNQPIVVDNDNVIELNYDILKKIPYEGYSNYKLTDDSNDIKTKLRGLWAEYSQII